MLNATTEPGTTEMLKNHTKHHWFFAGCAGSRAINFPLAKTRSLESMIVGVILLELFVYSYQLVPHKVVAEVSKMGNQ